MGTFKLPASVLPQAIRLPSDFCPTNADKVEKIWVKPVAVAPVGDLPPPLLVLPHDLTVPSFLRAVNACSLE